MGFSQEALFFLQAILLIGLPFSLWYFKTIRRFFPVVVLQVLIGIMLGPSILGKFYPEAFAFLFPTNSLAFINGISWIAVTFLGLLTGLHFDMSEIQKKGKSVALTSISGILLPFLFAAGSLFFFPQLYQLLAGSNATPLTVYLSLGIIVSVTALPVLAAILIEMGLIQHQIGKTVLSYATINDGILWILVSLLFILISGGSGNTVYFVLKVLTILAFLLFMVFVVKPILRKLVLNNVWTQHPKNLELVAISVLTLLSAFIGELIGFHYFLGALLFGAIIPKEISKSLYDKIEPLIFAVLLAFFFMSIGLKTVFDFASAQVWIIFGIVTTMAVIGKLLGVMIPVVLYDKMKLSEAAVLGIFMQCKGLMEIVVLTMVFNAGIINAVAFSGLIFMALITTAGTMPAVRIIQKISK